MRKKILTIIICLFSIFLFCGCAKINYSLTLESSGVVTQAINLQVSEKDIVNADKTLNNFKRTIEKVANQVAFKSYEAFLNSHQLDEELKTYSGNIVKFAEIIEFVNKSMDPNQGKAKVEWSRNGDIIYCKISLKFSNIYAYRYFYDSYPDKEEETETIREDHFFYAKDISYSDSPFNDIAKEGGIGESFMQYFDNRFTYGDISCSFTYSTPNSKIYTDADYVEKDTNGNTVHTWTFTTEQIMQDGKSKLGIYTVKYRAYVWYIYAVGITFLAGLVLLAIAGIKESKKRKYQSHFIGTDLSYFEKTSKEISEANKKDDNQNQDS